MNRACILSRKAGLSLLVCVMAVTGSLQAQDVPFKKVTLTKKFYGEGIHLVDMNADGKKDVIAGPYIYLGPDFTSSITYCDPLEYDPLNYSESYLMRGYDFNGDKLLDIFKFGRAGSPAFWYQNPGAGKDGFWKAHKVLDAPGDEARYFTDLDKDGRPEAVFVADGKLAIGRPDWKNIEQPWTVQYISRDLGWQKYTHGMGVADINKDGRADVLAKSGWWEQPKKGADKGEWIEHAYEFSKEGGAQMLVYDVNADGKVDIITSLDAHGYGMAWFEQTKDKDKGITFEKHMIMGDRKEFEEGKYPMVFSQPHTLALGDINGDGLMDFSSGKRYWAHGPKGDDEPLEAPVLYWFELVRKGKTVTYVPHLVDNDSGAGCTMEMGDIDGDKKTDILVANKYGAYLFFNQRK
ncbi:MAG TPA: VCBS repeat-containing protein [Cyclobacteriaceae bacterium]|nr:VCBS repeat-containing protein [Cyclobacteriaceae bacterium]